METWMAINQRQSIRKFKDQIVPLDDVKHIIESGCKAPSAGNIQPWRFLILNDKEIIEKITAPHLSYIKNICNIIVVSSNIGESHCRYPGSDYHIMDVSMATQNMLLTIEDMKLGAVCVGAFNREYVKDILDLPPMWFPLLLIPFGYPDETPLVTSRKNIDEIAYVNRVSDKCKLK